MVDELQAALGWLGIAWAHLEGAATATAAAQIGGDSEVSLEGAGLVCAGVAALLQLILLFRR